MLKSAVASAIAFVISTIFNFWASITWVFNTTNKKLVADSLSNLLRLPLSPSLIFDEGMLAWLVSSDWHPMIAKVVTTAFGMVFNFITRKIFLEDDNKLKEKIHKVNQTPKKES